MRTAPLSTRSAIQFGPMLLLAASLAGQALPQFRPLPRHVFPSNAGDAPFKVAVGDLNKDGVLDIVFANMGGTMPGLQDRVFLSDGIGGFTDVTNTNLPLVNNWTGSVALGDVDRDGDLDIYFGNSSAQISTLYLNDGTGKFTDVTATNLPNGGLLGRTMYAAAMVDVEFDGDLDIITRDMLLLNNGLGVFTDVTATHMPSLFYPWGMAVGDVNGDVFPDLILGGVNAQPQLWLNDRTGKFVDATGRLPAGSLDVRGSIGLGDVDGDGDRDIYMPYFKGQNRLWLNDGAGNFSDASATHLPQVILDPYGCAMADLDNDGDLDVVTANSLGGVSAQQSQFHLNDGTGKFTDVTATRFAAAPHRSASIAIGDMDQDGDNDIVFGNWLEQTEIWYNHHRQVYAEAAPLIATPYDFDVYGMPGYATTPQSAVVFIGAAPLVPRTNVPPLGFLGINPSAVIFMPGLPIVVPGGKATIRIPVPNNVALRGAKLYWQGVVLQIPAGSLFTNVFVDIVQ